MNKALLVGSFDPPTYGHLDLIQRASFLVSKLYVGIAKNSAKHDFLKASQRFNFLVEYFKKDPKIEIIQIEGLTSNYAKNLSVDFLIRGIRSSADLEREMVLAQANFALCEIETLFLGTAAEFSFQSSTLIREISQAKGSLKKFVPPEVEDMIYASHDLEMRNEA